MEINFVSGMGFFFAGFNSKIQMKAITPIPNTDLTSLKKYLTVFNFAITFYTNKYCIPLSKYTKYFF